MKDQFKTKQALIRELAHSRERVFELEQSESERKRVEKQILVANERLQYLLSSTSAVIYTAKPSGTYGATFISENVTRMTGYNPEEFIGDSNFWSDHVHPEDRPIISREVSKIFEKKFHTYEYRFKCRDGSYIWVSDEMRLVRDNDGNPIEIIGFWLDITQHKQAEEEVARVAREWQTTFDAVTDVIWILDKDYRVRRSNRAAERVFRRPMEAFIGKHCWEIVHGTNGPIPECPILKMKNSLRRESMELQVGNVWFEVVVDPILGADGRHNSVVHIISDITDRKRAEDGLRESEAKYRELSIIDDLTQLYNSRHFYQQLKTELDRTGRYGQSLSLLLLDLDDFKEFNDSYGHIEGDVVLSRLGRVVKRCLRQTDSAYRYGGEEFTILLPMTTCADSTVTAERIRMEFKREIFFPVPGKNLHLTVSIGLAQYRPKEDMKAFVHRVDQLMYQAKKSGKDRICSES